MDFEHAHRLRALLKDPRTEDGKVAVRVQDDSLEFASEETGVPFPTVGGLPCLFDEPQQVVARWSRQLREFDQETSKTANAVLAQLAGGGVNPAVRRRLVRLQRELERHRNNVVQLLRDAGVEPAPSDDGADRGKSDGGAAPGAGSSGSSWAVAPNPAESRLDVYLHQIHRDWGWEDRSEIDTALKAVLDAWPTSASPGAMLVFGGGAARLPFELHRRLRADATVVLDVDVLAMCVVGRILRGETVELAEFPAGPRDAQSTVVTRQLRAEPAMLEDADRFHLVFGDGLAPPVADGVFDTVLTPWFIDQVPQDLATFIPTVRRVLAPGGVWLNHGPLIYEPRHTMLVHRYTEDEARSIVEAEGFEVEVFESKPMTFLQSPASTRGRTETVLTFRAVKRQDIRSEASPSQAPDWSSNPDLPVEPWPGLAGYRPPHPMFAAIIALLDGKRSARDIAEVMVRKHGLPQDAALGGVMAALAEMLRGTQDAL